MAASDQICQLDTITLARAVAAKELSPVEAVEAVLDRLDRLDPTLHMFTTVVPDQAREDAKRIETDLAAGREIGPLAGVPTGVKDLICTKGIRTASDRMPTPISYLMRTTSWWSGSRPLVRW